MTVKWKLALRSPAEIELADAVTDDQFHAYARDGYDGKPPTYVLNNKHLVIERDDAHVALRDLLARLEEGKFKKRAGAESLAKRIRRETSFAGRL